MTPSRFWLLSPITIPITPVAVIAWAMAAVAEWFLTELNRRRR